MNFTLMVILTEEASEGLRDKLWVLVREVTDDEKKAISHTLLASSESLYSKARHNLECFFSAQAARILSLALLECCAFGTASCLGVGSRSGVLVLLPY